MRAYGIVRRTQPTIEEIQFTAKEFDPKIQIEAIKINRQAIFRKTVAPARKAIFHTIGEIGLNINLVKQFSLNNQAEIKQFKELKVEEKLPPFETPTKIMQQNIKERKTQSPKTTIQPQHHQQLLQSKTNSQYKPYNSIFTLSCCGQQLNEQNSQIIVQKIDQSNILQNILKDSKPIQIITNSKANVSKEKTNANKIQIFNFINIAPIQF